MPTTTTAVHHRRAARILLAILPAVICGVLATMIAPVPAHADTPMPSNQFNIRNLATGKCVDLPGFERGRPGGPVEQYTCDYTGRDNQEWQLVRTNAGHTPARYVVKNRKDGNCLDLPYFGRVKPGTPVTEYPCAKKPAKDNQEFVLPGSSRAGYHKLVHVKSPKLCLDVDGFRTGGNGARLTLWTCSKVDAADDHLWELRTGIRADQISFAINVARNQAKLHPDYAYGGGHGAAPGPTRGHCADGNGWLHGECVAAKRHGYDCSGLMRYVFARATGWDWGPWGTSHLSAHRPEIFGSTIHRVELLRLGDLVLLDTGGKGVSHTGIVSKVSKSGKVSIIEAPNTRTKLREAPLHGKFVKAYRLR